jgi:Protein of unknown function with HXXEE motif
MPFRRLQWLFPIAVTLHNGEEAIAMPGWAARHAEQLPLHPPSAASIRIALLALTLAAFVVTYLSAREGKQSIWAYLLFGGIVAMLVNVFVPHVPASLWFHSYTPGVVSAVLINLPLMSWLAVRAVREEWVSGGKTLAYGLAVPVTLGGLILVLLHA